MDKIKIARKLRQNQTDTETRMWYFLRDRRFQGVKFRRQVIIGNYIVDFISFKQKIIIELDGGQHNEKRNQQKDAERTVFFNSQGFKVIRFWDNEVFENADGVLEEILKNIQE